MKRTILVCGHGPGISDAVARRFGREGLTVAIVARNAARLAAAADALGAAGIEAKGLPCDLSRPEAIRDLVKGVRTALGPVAVVHWNPYGGMGADLVSSPVDSFRGALDVSVLGLIAAVQESLPDLKAQSGSVLVTGGGLSTYDAKVDATAVEWGASALAIAKAAQHKTAGVLHARLAREGVFVGEVVVHGLVKGTAFDSGGATLDPNEIADRFWELHTKRTPATVNFG